MAVSSASLPIPPRSSTNARRLSLNFRTSDAIRSRPIVDQLSDVRNDRIPFCKIRFIGRHLKEIEYPLKIIRCRPPSITPRRRNVSENGAPCYVSNVSTARRRSATGDTFNLDARTTRPPHARTCVPGWRMPAKSVTLRARSAKLQGVPCSFESAVGSVQLFVQSERLVAFFSRPRRLRSALMSGYPAQESASTFNSIPLSFPCHSIRFTMPLAWTRISSSTTGGTGSTRKTIGTRAAGTTGRGISYRRRQCRISSCASRCSITGAPLRTFRVGVADRPRIGESTGAVSGKIVDTAGTTGTGEMFPGELHRHPTSAIIHTSTIRVPTNSERYESGIIATSLERIWRATNLTGHSEARWIRTARMSRIAYPPFASGPMHRRETAPTRVIAQAAVSRRTAETTMSGQARRHRP
jgi:hypothetical protein